MEHPIHSIKAATLIAPYTLRIEFEDRSVQTIDFEPMLRGELYGPLRDGALFNEFKIDPEVHTLVWPNGADFDPTTLHHWTTEGPLLVAQARGWEASPVEHR